MGGPLPENEWTSEGPSHVQLAEHEYRMRQDALHRADRAYAGVNEGGEERDRVVSDGICGQLEMLIDQISKTHALVGILTDRINPILAPDMDDRNIKPMGDDTTLRQSDVIESVKRLHSQVRRIQFEIATITERVQL